MFFCLLFEPLSSITYAYLLACVETWQSILLGPVRPSW